MTSCEADQGDPEMKATCRIGALAMKVEDSCQAAFA